MTPHAAEQIARRMPSQPPSAAFSAGLALLRADYAEELLPAAQVLAGKHPRDARMHQLAGLAARTAGESEIALAAFATAASLAPHDALIAHSHARTALEAGRPSVALFDKAARLGPTDGSVLLGRTAALLQQGESTRALEDLAKTVDANPQWHEGHRSLAHLAGQLGQPPTNCLDDTLARFPRDAALHRLRISLLLEAREPEAAAEAASAAKAALGATPDIVALEAHARSETGDLAAADALFDTLDCHNANDASLHARHLLRAGRPDHARDLIEPFLGHDPEGILWPYFSLAWRLTGDERWQWLEGDPDLVGVYDIGDQIGDLAGLAEHLRSLHFAVAAPLDQSVRGGTQTDGNLLLLLDPPIRKLRRALLDTVARHVATLPKPQAGHPTLPVRRAPQRIAGSWSVRLEGAGFHVDHVHSQGWLSSAFYAAMPDTGGDDEHAGWLSLGECRELAPDLAPVRLVEPKPGRLALFPSTMWHGTRPFSQGERLTVAFDIARPKQS